MKSGFVGLLGASQGAGMGGDGARTSRSLARLDGDDRLFLANTTSDAHEFLAGGQAFHVAKDDARVRVLLPGLQKVNLADVGLVAQANKAGAADFLGQGPVQPRRAQSARLRHEGDRALRRQIGRKRSVEAGSGVDDAQAVGANDPDAVLFGNRHQLFFQLGAFLARLTETGADDDHALDAFFAAFFEHRSNKTARDHDQDHVDRAGHVGYAGVALEAEDVLCFGVNRVYLALIAIVNQVIQDRVA